MSMRLSAYIYFSAMWYFYLLGPHVLYSFVARWNLCSMFWIFSDYPSSILHSVVCKILHLFASIPSWSYCFVFYGFLSLLSNVSLWSFFYMVFFPMEWCPLFLFCAASLSSPALCHLLTKQFRFLLS